MCFFFRWLYKIFFHSSYLIRRYTYITRLSQLVREHVLKLNNIVYENVRLRLRSIDLRAKHDNMDGKRSSERLGKSEKKEKRNENKNFHWTRILSSSLSTVLTWWWERAKRFPLPHLDYLDGEKWYWVQLMLIGNNRYSMVMTRWRSEDERGAHANHFSSRHNLTHFTLSHSSECTTFILQLKSNQSSTYGSRRGEF